MKDIITFILISTLIIPSFKSLMFLAIGETYDEAITLHERGIISFVFTRIKLLMDKVFKRKYLEI
ncbi:hypothetical protein [Clostridium sp.]|uniref:hypothetical protein n=1 Tax=Clostridium sp. TaxID=1506 RepID=UPI002FC76DF4